MVPLARDRLGQFQQSSNLAHLPTRNMCSIGRTLLRNCAAQRCHPLLQQQQGVLRHTPLGSRHVLHSTVEAAAPTAPAVDTDASSAAQQASTAYPFPEIESKWQQYWEQQQTFRTPEGVDTSKPKYYVLDMFPYPR